MKQSILASNVNTFLGSLLILSFGLFVLTIGFRVEHMVNPIEDALAAQFQAGQ